VEPSHVLLAMGIPRPLALGTLRFSFSHQTTAADVERVADAFPPIVERARRLASALGRG
jgi:cysteine desulfurase